MFYDYTDKYEIKDGFERESNNYNRDSYDESFINNHSKFRIDSFY